VNLGGERNRGSWNSAIGEGCRARVMRVTNVCLVPLYGGKGPPLAVQVMEKKKGLGASLLVPSKIFIIGGQPRA